MNRYEDHNKRKTCKRYDIPGDTHSLTFSCYQQRPYLSKDRSRLWMIEAIDRARSLHHFHLWAYVIMPEHVHLLICPTQQDYEISEILASMKKSVTRKAFIFLKHDAPEKLSTLEDRQPNGKVAYRFWQRGGRLRSQSHGTQNDLGPDRLHSRQPRSSGIMSAFHRLGVVERYRIRISWKRAIEN